MEAIRPIAKNQSKVTRCNSEKFKKIPLQPNEVIISNKSIDAKRKNTFITNKSDKSLINVNRPLSQVNLDVSSLNSSISSQSSCDSSTKFTIFDPNQILNSHQIDFKVNHQINCLKIINKSDEESVDHEDSASDSKILSKLENSDRPSHISLKKKLADKAKTQYSKRNKENEYNFNIINLTDVEIKENDVFRSTPNLDSMSCEQNEIQELNSFLADDMTMLVETSPIRKLHSYTIIKNEMHRRHMQRFKLIEEGDLQICKLQRPNNMFAKFLNSKLLRRWKPSRIVLRDTEITSNSKSEVLNCTIPYHTILELNPISKWEPGQKYCLRIATTNGIYLLQANNIYIRDQWIHSIIWKKHKFKSERILQSASRKEILIKEINNMIAMSLTIPIEDTEIYQFPLDLIAGILQQHKLPKQVHEDVIVSLSPLLEKNHPSPQICDFFSKHCRDYPRSNVILDMFSPVVQRILKHNGDFGRHPRMRLFIQDYLIALMSQNAGLEAVQKFVIQMHSTSIQCPFPRVLPNFVSVCLASIHGCYESHRLKMSQQPVIPLSEKEQADQLICHSTMLHTMSLQEDWRTHLSQLLQSVPFPDQALRDKNFIKIFKNVVKNFAQDPRCEVHQTLLGIREGKEGWLEIFCPGGISCDDDGELFIIMLDTLMNCCCKKKRFLLSINKLLPHLHILAGRGIPCAVNTFCAMLDLDGLENPENVPAVKETLQQTTYGLKMYAKVCERLIQLRELQQKGGPRKLTLPSRSTDEDLAKILFSGSFGNLECLSLAFTNVTSACAEYLIKLPSLRYLNLWSTKFGDQGLELISEHLQRLQVLNLCETSVTDKGLSCLASMKQLRKLNLNSTNLSALTFEGLKECLPALQECDIRYTDAW